MRILALDFDGVLFNTLYDNMLNAFNSYLTFYPETSVFNGKKLAVKDLAWVKKNKATKLFKNYVVYVRCTEELVLVFYCIDKRIRLTDFSDMDNAKREFSIKRLLQFQAQFYKSRYNMHEHQDWTKLNKPYQKVINAIKGYSNIYLVTNKDKRTVELLLKHAGVRIKGILDKDISINKSEKFKMLIKNLNIIPQNIYYIDDNIYHILQVSKIGVNCYLADWGYNSRKDIASAKKKGIPILSQEDIKNVVQ